MEKVNPSDDYIRMICSLYGDHYDDREEDSVPGGKEWVPGEKSNHTSLVALPQNGAGKLRAYSTNFIRFGEWPRRSV